MKKIFILLIFITVVVNFEAKAQRDYSTGIGARLSPAAGITVKTFLSENSAFEGILSTRWRGFILTGLYELHQDAFNTTNFNFYYGVGAHVGWWDDDDFDHPWWDDDRNAHTVVGIDGIIGLGYTFDEIPFNISIDWKPMFTFIDYSGFTADEAAFSVRYAIK